MPEYSFRAYLTPAQIFEPRSFAQNKQKGQSPKPAEGRSHELAEGLEPIWGEFEIKKGQDTRLDPNFP